MQWGIAFNQVGKKIGLPALFQPLEQERKKKRLIQELFEIYVYKIGVNKKLFKPYIFKLSSIYLIFSLFNKILLHVYGVY